MTRNTIQMAIGNDVFKASMLEKKAPTICETIWKDLPIKTTVHHAKLAGLEMMCQLSKVYTDKRENSVKVYEKALGIKVKSRYRHGKRLAGIIPIK